MPDFIFPFSFGLTDSRQVARPQLGRRTVNVYQDREGYLCNYAGRVDLFRRAPPDLPAYVSTPPLTNTKITRLQVFRDSYGVEHIVFVQGATICRVDGNGYKALYTLSGRNYGGQYFPDMFVHESKLIIVNFGDPVLMWDGLEAVHPLGVYETPIAPEVRSHPAPGAETANNLIDRGPWVWTNCWWPQEQPYSGPSDNVDVDDNRINGKYEVCIQFKDKYGNKGRVSPPSNIETVRKMAEIGTGVMTNPFFSYEYLISNWLPPMYDDYITGVIIGRTANLHSEDGEGGPNAYGLFYVEKEFDEVTSGRFVHQLSDAALIEQGFMDLSVGPPPQATHGCSWNGMIFLGGLEDANEVVWSDTGYFGQFRASNVHRLADHFVCAIPLKDRVVVISRSSTEVLYMGSGGMAVLEQDFANGSYHGRSFVDIGGAVFGLWNGGFGIFDGEHIQFVETPYYIRELYVDPHFYVHSAIKVNEWYILSTRTSSALTVDNNRLLCYNLQTKQWYQLAETVFDLAFYRGAFIGCYDSIYELFRGPYSESIVEVDGIIPEGSGPGKKRVLQDVKLLMEASSSASATIVVTAEYDNTLSNGSMKMSPSRQEISRNKFNEPCWNDTGLRYDMSPEWTVPGDYWIKPDRSVPVTGFYHRIQITFPAGHPIRLKAILLSYGDSEDVES